MNIPKDASLILFDGLCNLCDRWVQRIIRNDPSRKFYFASLQSELGKRVVKQQGIVGNETIILVQNELVYTKSKAAFNILKELRSPLKYLAVFSVFPEALTDLAYNFIAGNRYKIYGMKDNCMVPEKNVQERFIDL